MKHSEAPSESMMALVSWAVHRAGTKKVTLTAAQVVLLEIYAAYGFVADVPTESWSSMDPKTKINAPMTLAESARPRYVTDHREDVFWEMLPDLIG